MRPVFALFVFIFASDVAVAEDSASVAVVGLDGRKSALTLSQLDALPQVEISAKEQGKPHAFEGALLGDVLAKVGAPAGRAIRGEELADVVIIEARDGYKVALDLAGTDPTMRNERVILADRMDGAPLDFDHGPFLLVAWPQWTHAVGAADDRPPRAHGRGNRDYDARRDDARVARPYGTRARRRPPHDGDLCHDQLAVLLRLMAPLLGAHYVLALSLSAVAWCGAFGGFALFYYRPLTRPRVGPEGGKPI